MTSTMKSVRVADDQAGGRLDRVLATHIAELSRTRIKALIEAGAVAVDGRTIRDPGHRVNSGAAVEIDIPPPAAAKPAPEAIPLNVVYEDADIIVIDKPRTSSYIPPPAIGPERWSTRSSPIAAKACPASAASGVPASCIGSTRTRPASWS